MEADGAIYEALVARIAINVVRKSGEETNLLPEILRRWFGDDAGLPGRGERVRLKRSPSGFEKAPYEHRLLRKGCRFGGDMRATR